MREPSWALNMLAEVLSAFTVDEPHAMVNVVFRVAENLDAEVAAILRNGKLEQSVGVMDGDAVALIKAVGGKKSKVQIEAGTLHLCLSPLGKKDYFVVGRLVEDFDLEERSLMRAMARSIELSSQVVQAMEAERLATRLQEELKLADSIQRRMLCEADELNRQTQDLDVSGIMLTSKEVGGDLYDWISLGAQRYCFAIGDVSGKGMPAALLMSTCLSLLRAYAEVFDSPSAIMRRINQRLCHNNEDCSFTTLLIGILDASSGRLTYCNAGHNPSIIQRCTGEVELLSEVHGPGLGILEAAAFGESVSCLGEDERLLAYTDGANETFNRRSERYGMRRLLEFTRKHTSRSSSDFLVNLIRDLKLFSGGEPIHDDTTLLTIYRPKERTQRCFGESEIQVRIRLPNDISATSKASAEARRFLEAHQIPKSVSRKVMVIVDDLVNNTINYGCKHLGGQAFIELTIGRLSDGIMIRLVDNGLAFNPLKAEEPVINSDVGQRAIGGLGIHLMKRLTSSSCYRRKDGLNSLILEIRALP